MNLPQTKYFLALRELGTFQVRLRSAVFPNNHFRLQFGDWNTNSDVPCSIADRLSGFRPLGEAVKPHFEAILREIDKIHHLSSEGITHSGHDQGREANPSDGFTCARRRVMTV